MLCVIFFQCPFCTKAFLNNSYLQSHIIRRHSAGTNNNKDGSSSLSPDLGVGSDSGRGQGNNLDAEVSQIKERLLRQEAELKEEKRALLSLKNKVCVRGPSRGNICCVTVECVRAEMMTLKLFKSMKTAAFCIYT